MFDTLYKLIFILTMLVGYLIFHKQKYMSTRWNMMEPKNQKHLVNSSAILHIGHTNPNGNFIHLLRIGGLVLMQLESLKGLLLKYGSFHYQDIHVVIVVLQ